MLSEETKQINQCFQAFPAVVVQLPATLQEAVLLRLVQRHHLKAKCVIMVKHQQIMNHANNMHRRRLRLQRLHHLNVLNLHVSSWRLQAMIASEMSLV